MVARRAHNPEVAGSSPVSATNRPYKFRLVRSYFLYFKSELAVNYECIRSHSQILNRAENHSDFRISLRFPSGWSKIGVLADFCTISQDGLKSVRSFSVFGLQGVSIDIQCCCRICVSESFRYCAYISSLGNH